MYARHQQQERGDLSFIDKTLRRNVLVYHMDSYPERFQGSFYLKSAIGDIIHNTAPLELLALASKYKIDVCNCTGESNPHIVWTIWFKTAEDDSTG